MSERKGRNGTEEATAETQEQVSSLGPTIGAVLEQIAESGQHLAHFVEVAEGGQLTTSSIRDILAAVDHLVLAARGVSMLLDQKDGRNEQEVRGLYG